MDPIADMLTVIRNALAVHKKMVTVPYSKVKLDLVQVLKDKGFVAEVNKRGRGVVGRVIEIVLKYDQKGQPKISGITRRSRPSQRVYIKKTHIRSVKQGLGIAIFSTSKGLMSNQDALKAGVGGELICEIW